MQAPTQPPTLSPAPVPLLCAVTRDAASLAEQMGVRIFTADIIYHLFDQFTAYLKTVSSNFVSFNQCTAHCLYLKAMSLNLVDCLTSSQPT